MPVRPVAAGAAVLLVLAACSGGPAASGPGATPPAGTGAAPPATGPAATAAAIDLSQVDACALVDEGTVEALTGETGFAEDGSSSASSASCFWAVTRPGVPQYLEVQLFRRNQGLADYTLSPDGVACPGVAVAGVGAEAKGGVCIGAQKKVYLVAMDRGVAVQVVVNEPKGALTPGDLADAVNGAIAGLQ